MLKKLPPAKFDNVEKSIVAPPEKVGKPYKQVTKKLRKSLKMLIKLGGREATKKLENVKKAKEVGGEV